MNLSNFKKHTDWVKVWSGKWSIHSCSQFGGEWTYENKVTNDSAFHSVVYLSRKGISDCWVSQSEKDDLGRRLTNEIRKDDGMVKKFADDLKAETVKVFSFLKDHTDKKIDKAAYELFWKRISDYYMPHLTVKYIVDYLSADELKKYLPVFEEARLYSEPVFREEENFMEKIAGQIAEKTGLTKDQVLSTRKEELRKYFDGGVLPEAPALEERFRESIQFFERGESLWFQGSEAKEMEKIVLPKTGEREIRGQTAFGGRARGRVRIVIDPLKDGKTFEKGDILVTGMTRPEFLPLMEKAAAFVTDAGGILSHAAIVARETKRPCIIGTQIATKVLKNGDLVEVDADNGVVKILKRAG